MGAYLSKPITKKFSSDEVGTNVAVGASSMQGWRISQEDAHNCCINFDKDVSLFAVYDGHGGREVATYCARNLPIFIKQTEAYKRGDIRQALIDAFLGFDATLAQPEVINILKKLAGTSTSDNSDHDLDDTDEEENVSNLRLEATMPLDQVIAKYRSEVSSPRSKKTNNERSNKGTCSYIRGRKTRDKDSCLASGASCSSSSSSSFLSSTVWNTNEADVSSSSQPCGSSTSSNTVTKGREFLGNNEAEQVLDSTSSSDSSKGASVSRIESTIDTVKSVDMPDSSEDVKEKVSSPSKEARIDSDVSEAELNGVESKRIIDADSSKGGNDNVSSSSSSPSESNETANIERVRGCVPKGWQSFNLFDSILKVGKQEAKKSDDEQEQDGENKANKQSNSAFSERLRCRKGTDNTDEEKSERDSGNDKEDEIDAVEEELDDEDEDDDDYDEDEDDNIDDDEDDEDDDEDEEDDDDEDDDTETSLTNLEEPGSDSGCTAVVAILKNNELYVANAGDSRCVLCRDGQALELSLDHKPEDEPEMERIVKAGGKVTADGRVNGGLNLSRALGDHAYKKNTVLPPQEQMISALPDVRHVTIEPERDEFMVLACDGIWNFMSSQEVIDFVRARLTDKYDNISKICEELFDYCLAPDTYGDGTGCDNMTAVIVRFKTTTSLPNDRPNSGLAETSDTCTKKRSISPVTLPEGSNDCVTEENTSQSYKRPKTEAVIEVVNETS